MYGEVDMYLFALLAVVLFVGELITTHMQSDFFFKFFMLNSLSIISL